jgi:hypothetical protein
MMKDDAVSSVAQDEWESIAESVREQFRKQIPLMAAMKPEELSAFLEALRKARWLEEDARTFDKDVELKLSKLWQE